ncbi:MAG: hypothetical protein ABL921_24565 [Pirellula sp.]
MDRSMDRKDLTRWIALCFAASLSGCVTNPIPTATVWDKLGITGAGARLRDSTINRSGNFPGLEKKPPVLRLADPANLAPEKPEVIKTAAKIKQDQDLKKQKIKAIKFLAEVNCGCYNKDDAVAKAFLEALGDCDPDVRQAAVEAICTTAGNCSKCKTGCETTCCSEEILKKLNELANGKDANGCPKESVPEIRSMAAAAIRKCPCPQPKPIEEIPAPAPHDIEELGPAPEVKDPSEEDATAPGQKKAPSEEDAKSGASVRSGSDVSPVSFSISGGKVTFDTYGTGTEQVKVAKRRGKNGETIHSIANPDHLINTVVIQSRKQLGEILIELPEVFEISQGWSMVVVDKNGNHQVGKVNEASGRRVLIGFDNGNILNTEVGTHVRIGLVKN